MWSYNKKEFAFPVLLVDRMQITNVWFQLLCNAAKILSFLKQFDCYEIAYDRDILVWLRVIILLKMFLWGNDTTMLSLKCFLYYFNYIPFLVEGFFWESCANIAPCGPKFCLAYNLSFLPQKRKNKRKHCKESCQQVIQGNHSFIE